MIQSKALNMLYKLKVLTFLFPTCSKVMVFTSKKRISDIKVYGRHITLTNTYIVLEYVVYVIKMYIISTICNAIKVFYSDQTNNNRICIDSI